MIISVKETRGALPQPLFNSLSLFVTWTLLPKSFFMFLCCIYPTLAFTEEDACNSNTLYLPVFHKVIPYHFSFYLSSCHTYCLNSLPYPICLSRNPTLSHNNKLVILPILSHTVTCIGKATQTQKDRNTWVTNAVCLS